MYSISCFHGISDSADIQGRVPEQKNRDTSLKRVTAFGKEFYDSTKINYNTDYAHKVTG